MDYAAMTNIGMRPQNEDSYALPDDSGVPGLFLLADGMGGYERGEVASALAIQAAADFLRENQENLAEKVIQDAVTAANNSIWRETQQDSQNRGMGTTLVLAFAMENEFWGANVGDSRLYQLSDKRLHQISRDHSLVAELVAAGKITSKQARNHPYQNIITRALGLQKEESADIYRCPWKCGDMLLLCSDGLTGALTDEQIERILSQEIPLQEICDQLVSQALICGATDNTTVVVVRHTGGSAE